MLLRYTPKVDHLKVVILTPKEGLVLTRGQVNLLPGVNEVTNDEFKAMRGNIQAEIDSGEIKILAQKVGDGRGKPGGRKARDLAEMPVNIAVAYVHECTNPDTLQKWYKEVTKEEVRMAISKKMKEMEIELPKDEIPETPNASPMSIDEYDKEENGIADEDEDVDDFLDDEDDEPENSEPENSDSDDLDDLDEDEDDLSLKTVAELRAMCKERGIETKNLSKKADFVNALKSDKE